MRLCRYARERINTMTTLSSLSNHYIIATTTDFTAKGGVSGYHVTRYDIMPIYLSLLIVIFSFMLWAATERIIIKITKKKKGDVS
jgi:hypothetical protein